MRFLTSLVAVVSTAMAVSAFDLKPHGSQTEIIPGSYIIQLKEGAALGRRDGDVHAHFESHMKRADVPYTIKTKFDVGDIFRGAAIQLASDDDAAKVAKMDSVLAVFPDKRVPRPEFGEVNAIGEVPAANPTDTYSTHQMTGVDKLHNMGIYGKGVKVAVIDTGIDYKHPALGNGCFGEGCKVAKGYDFVGDDYGANSQYIAKPDEDPIDCGGHGSHVAGIIGADANPLNFTGVAPQATLFAYRVFGCTGSTQSSIIIEAMLRAYQDGADVISISIGGGAAWTTDAEAVVASRLVDAGVILSVSEGNSGDAGLWYTSAPQLGLGVLSVASVQNTVIPSKAAILSNGNGPYFLKASEEIKVDGQKSVFLSSTDPEVLNDGCSAYAAGAATGKVALIRRGGCAFSIKAQNALDAGAEVVLFINNVPGDVTGADIAGVKIQSAVITQDDGRAIVAAIAADSSITISFPAFYYNAKSPDGGLVNDFTSYGLTADNYIKPQIAAPGGAILSTYPIAKGSYAVLDGTSMAAPFISGVAALFIQQNGKMDPHRFQNILQNSAKPIASAPGGSQLNTVAQQGAGLVDAFNSVIGFKAVVNPSEISLNDTEHLLATTTIHIDNIGSSSASYRLSNLPAAAALTFGDNKNAIARDVPLVTGDATVTFDQTFVTVAAGATVDVQVIFTPPTGLDPKTVPVYSGFIVVESADTSQRYTVPYAGTAASMRTDYNLLDRTADLTGGTIPALVSAGGAFVAGPKTFTFEQGDTLEIIYNLLGSSAMVTVDLVPSTYSLPASPVRRHLAQKKRLINNHHNASSVLARAADPTLTVVGNLSSEQYAYRNDAGSTDNQYNYFPITNGAPGFFFSDGTKVPNGDYKVLLRALKFYATDEYESWLSDVITVNQA